MKIYLAGSIFYYGDVLRRSRRWDQATEVNDHLTLSDEINVIADSYILENLNYMRYVIYLGVKWKINYIEVNRPRIRLTLGGEYNGEQTATASGTN